MKCACKNMSQCAEYAVPFDRLVDEHGVSRYRWVTSNDPGAVFVKQGEGEGADMEIWGIRFFKGSKVESGDLIGSFDEGKTVYVYARANPDASLADYSKVMKRCKAKSARWRRLNPVGPVEV